MSRTPSRACLGVLAVAASVLASCASRPWWEDPNRVPCCLDAATCAEVLRHSTDGPTLERQGFCVGDAESFLAHHVEQSLPVVRELLGSAMEQQRRRAAIVALMEQGNEEALAPVLAEAWFAHRDGSLFAALARNRSATLLPVWLDALDAPFAARVSVALERLADLGPEAAGHLERLADIATTHWDSEVRLAATRAYDRLAVGMKRIGPTLDRCPSSVRRRDPPDARWVVRLAQGDVELMDLTAAASMPRVHQTLPGFERSGQALVVGQDVVFAYSRLECGGGVGVWRDGKATELGHVGEPLLLEPLGDEVLVLGSCNNWTLGVVERGPDGAWRHRALAEGSGSPVAFGVEIGGAVDLLVAEDRSWSMPPSLPCEAPQATRVPFSLDRGQPFVLLRIARDGSVNVRE